MQATPTGDAGLMREGAVKITESADLKGVFSPTSWAKALFEAYQTKRGVWMAAGRPCPPLTVEAFMKHFSTCEEIASGKVSAKAVPVVDPPREPRRNYADPPVHFSPPLPPPLPPEPKWVEPTPEEAAETAKVLADLNAKFGIIERDYKAEEEAEKAKLREIERKLDTKAVVH